MFEEIYGFDVRKESLGWERHILVHESMIWMHRTTGLVVLKVKVSMACEHIFQG